MGEHVIPDARHVAFTARHVISTRQLRVPLLPSRAVELFAPRPCSRSLPIYNNCFF